MHTMLSVLATPDVANIRTAEFRGQEHTVIPVVALVEGVLWAANSPRPELALAEEFGRFPEGWNGRPVVFDHPKNAEGVPIAANDPEVLEDNAFGQMFNTTLDGKKLKSEIWINEELVKNLSEEGQATVAKLMAGDTVVEVSTGLFLLSEASTGDFNGEHFEAIWRNIVPDHLAILPEGTPGACSVSDGCGAPRDNNSHYKDWSPVMRAAQLSDNCECNTTSTIIIDGTTEAIVEQETNLLKTLLNKLGSIFIRDNSDGVNDGDLRTALDIALNANEQDFIWIAAVFQGNDRSGTVVYQKGFEASFLERTFSMNADGVVSLGEDKTSVRPETKFVPIELEGADSESSIQENAMHTKEELVRDLIANAASQFTEEDRGWLETLEDAQLAKLAPVVNEESEASSEDDSTSEDVDTVVDDNVSSLRPVGGEVTPISTDDYIAGAPEEIQAVLNSGLAMHRARKIALIAALTGNSRCKFTKEQLDSKDVPELENLAALAIDITYELGGANLSTNASDDDNAVPEPIKLFDLNANAQS